MVKYICAICKAEFNQKLYYNNHIKKEGQNNCSNTAIEPLIDDITKKINELTTNELNIDELNIDEIRIKYIDLFCGMGLYNSCHK